jgi:hypothetical protein
MAKENSDNDINSFTIAWLHSCRQYLISVDIDIFSPCKGRIKGKVIATQGGTVKLHLGIDETQEIGSAHPYVWAPPTGNFMYLMPKLGSEAILYFPDPGEENAKAINCVRTEASKESRGMANPSLRGLHTEQGKRFMLYPDAFGFESDTGGGPLRFVAKDDEGIAVETAHGITMLAGGSIRIEAPVIDVKSPERVSLYRAAGFEEGVPEGAVESRAGRTDVFSDGGRCAFTGTDATAYVTPKPVKKPFDVGKPVGNVFGGLAVVAGALLVAAAFVTETGEQGSGEEEGEAPDGAGLLLLAGLSMIPRRRRGMSLGPLSANPANIPRLAGNAPLLTGGGAGTPLLTDGGPLLKQILKTDAPHLNAELGARLATKEGGPDYAKRLGAMGLLSENGNAGRGAAGMIDASAISGGLAARANVSPNKPVSPIDDRSTARVTKNAAEKSDGISKIELPERNDCIDNIKIIDGKVGGKIPFDEFKAIRTSSIKNPDANSMTLGKYTKDADSYIARAGADSSYFDLGSDWSTVKKQYDLNDEEIFNYFNVPALEDAITNGKPIRFSHNPLENRKSFLFQEWKYIKKRMNLSDTDMVFRGGFWYVG